MKIYVQKGQNVQQNNTKKYVFLSLAAIFLISTILWFKFAGGSAVHDLRNTADAIRNELESAQDKQREQRKAIEQAGDAANRSAESIEDSQRTATEIKRLERSDAEIISGSEEILQRVRERGGTENQN